MSVYKLSIPKIDVEKRRNLSINHNYLRPNKFSKRYGFKEIKYKYDSEQIDFNNKNFYLKIEKIRTRKNTIGNYSKRLDSVIVSDISEKNRINISKDSSNINPLITKLNEINIPFLYYKKFFNLLD